MSELGPEERRSLSAVPAALGFDERHRALRRVLFQAAAWSWLAPPARLARARLLMQAAYVADAEAAENTRPAEIDAWGHERHDAHGGESMHGYRLAVTENAPRSP